MWAGKSVSNFMIINVGSKNQTKINAVKEAVELYPNLFSGAEVVGVDSGTGLFDHPKNIGESVEGAIARAKNSFKDCEYSFGLEGGLIEVPHTKTGYMEVGACAIYDGKDIYLGLSPAFEWPIKVNEMIIKGEADASQAFYKLGLTEHEKLGAMPGGIVGYLTDGKITRENFTKYSIIMALVQLERPELYR